MNGSAAELQGSKGTEHWSLDVVRFDPRFVSLYLHTPLWRSPASGMPSQREADAPPPLLRPSGRFTLS